jgi:hypothetical protein
MITDTPSLAIQKSNQEPSDQSTNCDLVNLFAKFIINIHGKLIWEEIMSKEIELIQSNINLKKLLLQHGDLIFQELVNSTSITLGVAISDVLSDFIIYKNV